jgi:hypothetical protein
MRSCGLFFTRFLVRDMTSHYTSRDCAQNGMVMSIVARNCADCRAFETALGLRCSSSLSHKNHNR